MKKKVLIFASKNIDTIDNSGVYDKYKDLYLIEKELEEKVLQGTQLANSLKTRVGAKKHMTRRWQ